MISGLMIDDTTSKNVNLNNPSLGSWQFITPSYQLKSFQNEKIMESLPSGKAFSAFQILFVYFSSFQLPVMRDGGKLSCYFIHAPCAGIENTSELITLGLSVH